jgi:hypothetical protein
MAMRHYLTLGAAVAALTTVQQVDTDEVERKHSPRPLQASLTEAPSSMVPPAMLSSWPEDEDEG